MSKYFSLSKDAEDFKKSDFLGKVGNGALIATKIVANVGIFALSAMAENAGSNARRISNNSNATSEQRERAREISDKSRDMLNNLNKERS